LKPTRRTDKDSEYDRSYFLLRLFGGAGAQRRDGHIGQKPDTFCLVPDFGVF
jgi:hypothetical protein